MNKAYLTFVIDKKKALIFQVNGNELKNPIDFKGFFDSFLSKESLQIFAENYSCERCLKFFLHGKMMESVAFESLDKSRYLYRIEKSDENIAEIHLFRKENNINDIDFLTGVHSRNYLFSSIQEEIQKGDNDDSYVIMIDLDNFKQINDNYGHIIGDMCLQTIAEKLQAIFQGEIFGRYGGDEFLAFVKHCNVDKLKDLIKNVLQVRFQYEKSSFSRRIVTCSVGVSLPCKNRKDIYTLISEADNALYLSKSKGKNKGNIYRSNVLQDNKKDIPFLKKKEKRIHSSSLFEQEILGKKIRSYSVLGLFLTLLIGALIVIDIFFMRQSDNQAKSIANTLSKEQSNSVCNEVINRINSSFENLKNVGRLIPTIETDDSEEGIVQKYVTYIQENKLLDNPGLLLSNGDVYFGDDQVFNITNSELSKEIILDKTPSVQVVSFLNQGERIVIGYPLSYSLDQEGQEIAEINGILSIYSKEEFSSQVFSDFLENKAYLALASENGNIICDSKEGALSFFKGYHNFVNAFLDKGMTEGADTFKKSLSDENEIMEFIDFSSDGNQKSDNGYYFFFGGSLSDKRDSGYVSDWRLIIGIPSSIVYSYFYSMKSFSLFCINILTSAFVAVFISVYFYLTNVRVHNFIVTYTDSLAGTINEQRFFKDATTLLNDSLGQGVYLAYLNIQKFKYLNNKLGTYEANQILVRVSEAISSRLDPEELITREYSDHFILFFKAESEMNALKKINNLMVQVSSSCHPFENERIYFNGGIYHFGKRNESILLAIDRAKAVCSEIKKDESRNVFALFDSAMMEKSELEIYIEQSMESALSLKRFEVYYQGKYDLKEDRFTACEALVRWKDDRKGFINTQAFINLFEKNGFILKLDLYVFEEVLKNIRERLDNKKEVIPVSINVSRRHFEDSDFFTEYEKKIKQYNIPGKYLEFEITESIVLDNQYNLTRTIDRIHELGAQVSIDDFGSGYSNLSMLNRTDFDILKMDRNLLFGKNGFDEYSKNILKMVVFLNKSLGKRVVCEGVEHKEESDFLRSIGCDWIQGYYYCKPLPKEDFIKRIDEKKE